MREIIIIIALCFNHLVFAKTSIATEETDSILTYNSTSYVDSQINQLLKLYNVPGASITVIKDRKILWSVPYGIKDSKTQEKITKNTMFQAASISKPITALAALHLSQKELLNIDKPAKTYLKSWKIPNYEQLDSNPLLVRHLMNHTSGFSVHGFRGYHVKETIPTLKEVLDGSRYFERLFGLKNVNSSPIEVKTPPGKGYKYSGGGYSVLQQVLVDITGSDFEALMHKNIFSILEMNNSTYQQPVLSKIKNKLASGHLNNGEVVDGKYHIYPEQAAAGLWTTSEDLAKVVIDIQKSLFDDSGLILNKNYAEKMTRPSFDTFLGLGFFLRNASNEIDDFYFYHDGWNKGFLSSLLGHKDGYGIVILTNANQPEFNHEVMNLVLSNMSALKL